MKRKILLLIYSLTALSVFAQSPVRLWDKRFAGDTLDYLNAIKRASNGTLFLAGKSNSKNSAEKSQTSKGGYDYWVVKTDSNGNKLWDATIGSANNEELFTVFPTPDGGCLLGGYTSGGKTGDKSQASFGSNDIWVVKLSNTGVKQWDSAYGGNSHDELHYIEPVTGGGYLLIGASYSSKNGNKKSPNKGDLDIWVVRIDSMGKMLWDSSYGGTGYDNCWEGHQTKDGGFLLAGWSKSSIGGNKTADSIGGNDVWLLKINSNGVVQWDKVHGGINNEEIYTFIELPDGGFVLPVYSNSGKTGNKNLFSKGSYDTWLIRTNALGNKIWERAIGGNSDDRIFALATTSDKSFMMSGYSYSTTGDRSKFNYGGLDYWIIKVDSSGRPQWDETLGGKRDDYLQDMVMTPGDNMVLAGYSRSGIGHDKSADTLKGGNYDFWITKIRQPRFYINKHDTTLCPNDAVYVKYLSTNTFADTNKIFLQLSDGYSNFATINNVGFKLGTKLKADSILALIPGNAGAAPYYKFRFVSSSPKDTSLWSFAVKILPLPKKPIITHYFDTLICSNSNGVLYQWLKNNVPIPGATQRKFVPTVQAYYSVRVDSPYACPYTSDAMAINNLGLSRSAGMLNFEASPNPFHDKLIITNHDATIQESVYQLLSIDGKLISEGVLYTRETVLDMAGLKAGIYILTITNEQGSGVLKLVKP